MTALTTVTDTITDPTGQPLKNKALVVKLITISPHTDQGEVTGTTWITTDATGAVSKGMIPNSLIHPDGSYYLWPDGVGGSFAIVVPATGGPYQARALESDIPPGPAPQVGVAVSTAPQSFTDTQKAQALANIGGAAEADLTTEVTRAQTAEAANSTAIVNEATTARAAEAALRNLTDSTFMSTLNQAYAATVGTLRAANTATAEDTATFLAGLPSGTPYLVTQASPFDIFQGVTA